MNSVRLYVMIFILLCLSTACRWQKSISLEVKAGAYERVDTPILVDLPDKWKDFPFFWLMNEDTDNYVPVQKTEDGKIVFLLDEALAEGTSRRYLLTTVKSDPNEDIVQVIQDSSFVGVQIGDTPVLVYHTREVMPPPGNPDYYARSGFIHPLYTPGGQVITEGFPPDHMHQHGVFFSWPHTMYKGHKVDFWNTHKQLGLVRHAEVVEGESGSVFGHFIGRLLHQRLDSSGKPENVLNETWAVKVYNLRDYFLIDLRSIQTTADLDALEILTYKYGGLGFRGSSQWFDPDYHSDTDLPENYLGPGKGGFLTSEGQGRVAGNHSRPRWVDMHGELDGVSSGITIMGHPDNYRYPQPVRLHPEMPYFSFSPSVIGDFTLQPGERYASHYRFFIHQDKPDREQIEHIWNDYVQPPVTVWIED